MCAVSLDLHVSHGTQVTSLASACVVVSFAVSCTCTADCKLQVGGKQVQSLTHEHGGETPEWGEQWEFAIKAADKFLLIECFDHNSHGDDSLIGSAQVRSASSARPNASPPRDVS